LNLAFADRSVDEPANLTGPKLPGGTFLPSL